MKIDLPRHHKDATPAWPWVGVGLSILGLVGLGFHFLPARLKPPCGFHTITGLPCPSCGTTRMGEHLLSGEILQAFAVQPYMFLLLSALALWVISGAIARLFGRDLFLRLSKGEEKWIWMGLVALFLVNWAYLWWAGV
jgi:hypothetical protein